MVNEITDKTVRLSGCDMHDSNGGQLGGRLAGVIQPESSLGRATKLQNPIAVSFEYAFTPVNLWGAISIE